MWIFTKSLLFEFLCIKLLLFIVMIDLIFSHFVQLSFSEESFRKTKATKGSIIAGWKVEVEV